MATIDDLDREVRRLRKRVNELENGPAAREAAERNAVEQLVAEDSPEKPFGGAFARALAGPTADLAAKELLAARDDLARNGLPKNQAAFRRTYSTVPGNRISDLLREFGG